MRTQWTDAFARIVILFVSYFAGAKLGLVLSDPVTKITLVWPATGIAVAGLLHWGNRYWLAVYLAALTVEKSLGHPWGSSASIAIGNTLAPLLTAHLLRSNNFDSHFDRRRDGWIFWLAAAVGMLLSGAGGALCLCLGGNIPWSAFGAAFTDWWLGDTSGVLLVGPLLLIATHPTLKTIRQSPLEFLALGASIVLASWILFMQPAKDHAGEHSLAFLAMPLIVWGAMRFGPLGAAFSSLFISSLAALATARALGPFYGADIHEGRFLLWMFITSTAFLGLMIITLQAERRQAEEEMLRSQQLLSRMGEIARLGGWSLDLSSQKLAWSEEVYRIHEVAPTVTPTVDNAINFYAPEARPVIRAKVEEAASKGTPWDVELPFITATGKHIWVRALGTAEKKDGKVLRLHGAFQDITARKGAEMALRESETRFRQLAEHIREVFWMANGEDGSLLYVSPGYEEVWGRTCESLYQSPGTWLEAVHPEDRERVRFASKTRQTLGTYDEEYRVIQPDGQIRWVHDRAFPIRDTSGKVYRVVGVADDITERRELEEQFRQSQKMEAIGQLAGGVAHDFNNILTVIEGNASLLADEDFPTSKQESLDFARQIVRASKRAADLTRQLLLFGRKQLMQPANMEINEVVSSMTKMLERILGEHIKLQEELAADLPLIHADSGMVEQIILNLAVNSRDAMPSGGRLTIKTSQAEIDERHALQHSGASPGVYVCLSVKDTGCGIASQHLPHIFEPFFTTKEIGKGSGLGLATVYGIVKQHRGWVTVESELNKGAIFQIYFPAAGGSPEPKTGVNAALHLPPGKETILVVEDEAPLRLLVCNLLRRSGYGVLEAGTGLAALPVWEQHKDKINLLLTDVMMPDGMNGLELAEQLKGERPQLKVIYFSGYSPDSTGKKNAMIEGDNFLAKPFTLEKLAHLVRTQLDKTS